MTLPKPGPGTKGSIGSLTAKGLERGPTHFFIVPIFHFLSYEFPHFHCPRFHSQTLKLESVEMMRLIIFFGKQRMEVCMDQVGLG